MKIALIGYGSMNRAIHAQSEAHGIEIVSIISPRAKEATAHEINTQTLNGAEVAIECSIAPAVYSNCDQLLALNIPVVVGTTGWFENLPALESLCKNRNGTLLWSSNFSIGVNVYFAVVRYAAKLFAHFPEYDVWGNELHHRKKSDAPSGTAKTLEKILLESLPQKESVVEDRVSGRLSDQAIHFSSTRGGFSNFEHTVGFDAEADCVTIKHAARNRAGFAAGALQVAQWLKDKKGFYSMDSFISDKIPTASA